MNYAKEKSLQFLNLTSSVDMIFIHISNFLNGRTALFFQSVLWYMFGYFCFQSVTPESTQLQQSISIGTSPVLFGTVMICVTWCDWPFTINGSDFFENHPYLYHPHLYSCLILVVEVTIVWAITLLKPWLLAQKVSWGVDLIVIAVYYTLCATFELLEINDRGVLNGWASVIVLVLTRRFGFVAVPITAAIVFGKNLICSNCCAFCRRRKDTNRAAEIGDNQPTKAEDTDEITEIEQVRAHRPTRRQRQQANILT